LLSHPINAAQNHNTAQCLCSRITAPTRTLSTGRTYISRRQAGPNKLPGDPLPDLDGFKKLPSLVRLDRDEKMSTVCYNSRIAPGYNLGRVIGSPCS
jgi:hypothetical protein